MSQEEIFKYLVKECHLSFEQIGNLDDYQICKILCLKDRPVKKPGEI